MEGAKIGCWRHCYGTGGGRRWGSLAVPKSYNLSGFLRSPILIPVAGEGGGGGGREVGRETGTDVITLPPLWLRNRVHGDNSCGTTKRLSFVIDKSIVEIASLFIPHGPAFTHHHPITSPFFRFLLSVATRGQTLPTTPGLWHTNLLSLQHANSLRLKYSFI